MYITGTPWNPQLLFKLLAKHQLNIRVWFSFVDFWLHICSFPFKDFEALTPNLLARTIETVEGGGLIVLLLRSLSSLTSLYTMVMVLSQFLLVVIRSSYRKKFAFQEIKRTADSWICTSFFLFVLFLLFLCLYFWFPDLLNLNNRRMFMRDFVQSLIIRLLGASMNVFYFHLLHAKLVLSWMMS